MPSLSLGGGLDVDGIVNQLMQIERAPARALESERKSLQSRIGALDRFERNLEKLRVAGDAVRKPNGLDARSALSSDPSSVRGVSASPGAPTGAFRVAVTQLAATHNLASTTFASLTDTLPHGTFDLRVGNGDTYSIAVQAGSDTLEGLRSAIQSSGAGVSASVLFDGSAYRLSVASGQSGLAGTVTINNFSSGALQTGLGISQTAAAADSILSVNGVSVSRSSNTVSDVIAGISFDLRVAGQPEANVSVTADPDQGVEVIQTFVEAYNTLFNEAKAELRRPGNIPGLLAQMSSVSRILDKLRSSLSRSVPGLEGQAQTLRQAGIELQNDGTITVDETKLRAAINSGDAEKLFGVSGRTTNPLIQYAGSGQSTQTGTYGVFVTQAAEQAVVSGANNLGGGLAGPETLTFARNGSSVDIQLTGGQTTAQVVTTINAGLAGSSMDVFAADDGSGRIKIASREYGSAATVSVTSNQDGAGYTGFGTAGMTDSGVDVAGTIAGQAATGVGRKLTASDGNAKGLIVEARATASDIAPGGSSLGDAVVSVGAAEAIHRSLQGPLASTNGSVALERTRLRGRDKVLEGRISTIDRRIDKRRVSLSRQLARADTALRQMASLSQQVQAQLGMFGG